MNIYALTIFEKTRLDDEKNKIKLCRPHLTVNKLQPSQLAAYLKPIGIT